MYTCHLMVVRRQRAERGRGLPNRLRRRAGLRPAAAADGTDRANPSHPAGALSLAQAAAVDGKRGTRQALGARCGTLGARGLRSPPRRRGRRAAGRSAGPLPRAAAHPSTAARVDRDSDRRPAARQRTAPRSTCSPTQSPASIEKTSYDALRVHHRRRRTPACRRRPTRALEGTRHMVLPFSRLGPFNFSAKINAGVSASSGEHLRAVQRRPRSHLAGLADGDARVFAGAGDRGRRRQAVLPRRPAAAYRHGARRRRRRRARVSSAPGTSRPATPAAPSSPATTRRSPGRA